MSVWSSFIKAEASSSFITTTVGEQRPRSHQRELQVGFQLATNSIQFYAVANLDKTSLLSLTVSPCTKLSKDLSNGQHYVGLKLFCTELCH